MDQSNSINNRMVKFVVSYCVVFKHVEVSTILASVESTGSWLHADTCPVFVRWVVLEILHDTFELTYFTAHKSISVLYGKEHGKYLYLENYSKLLYMAKGLNWLGEVDFSHWQPYRIDAKISPKAASEKVQTTVSGRCSAAPLSVQSSYCYEDILQIGEVLGHRI